MKRILISFLTGIGLANSVFVASAHAAGTAAFSLNSSSGAYVKDSSFSVQITENGTDVNVVTAKLVYDDTKLKCDAVSGAMTNTITANCSGGNITISGFTAPGSTVSGSQVVGAVNFTALVDTGSTAVSFTSGSQIASNGDNIWNGATTGGSYSFTAPVATPSPAPAPTPKSASSTKPASTPTQIKKAVSNNSFPVSDTNADETADDDTVAAAETINENAASVQGSTSGTAMNTTLAETEKSSASRAPVVAGIFAILAAAGIGVAFKNGSLAKSFQAVNSKITRKNQ